MRAHRIYGRMAFPVSAEAKLMVRDSEHDGLVLGLLDVGGMS